MTQYVIIAKRNIWRGRKNHARSRIKENISRKEKGTFMSKVRRVYVEKKPAFAVKAKELQAEIKSYLGISSVTGVRELIRYDIENISEKMLQRLILEDIPSFLKELGDGFSFIENEYKIKIGNVYNYIDLLLFNYIYQCFVVVELKVIELKKEHIGQIETYMHYIDKNLKTNKQDKTIGIILTKKDNRFIMEYCSDKRVLNITYSLQTV